MDRVDKSALSWDHHEELNKHESQKDYVKGFGGKFGVQVRKDISGVEKTAFGSFSLFHDWF
jgi:cortactin